MFAGCCDLFGSNKIKDILDSIIDEVRGMKLLDYAPKYSTIIKKLNEVRKLARIAHAEYRSASVKNVGSKDSIVTASTGDMSGDGSNRKVQRCLSFKRDLEENV